MDRTIGPNSACLCTAQHNHGVRGGAARSRGFPLRRPPFPATCKRAACNNKSQAGLDPGVQGCTPTGGWLVGARQGGGTGKDPPHKGSYWRRWYLTRAARCRHVTDSREAHDASSSFGAHQQKQQIEYFSSQFAPPDYHPAALPSCLGTPHPIAGVMSSKQISPLLQTWYKWKALRLPWRKRFLVGE